MSLEILFEIVNTRDYVEEQLVQFFLNGESAEMLAGTTIQDVLNTMEVGTKRYAVECNEEIVSRSLHKTTAVQEGDQIEIVVAIGGG